MDFIAAKNDEKGQKVSLIPSLSELKTHEVNKLGIFRESNAFINRFKYAMETRKSSDEFFNGNSNKNA